MVNSKAKGSSYERKVCKALSLWITDGKKADVFWRSAISGGRATVHHKKGVKIRQSGDICSVAPEGHALTDQYFIEIKHVRDLEIDSLILRGTGCLARFWHKAVKQAYDHGKEPLLIAKQNNAPAMVIAEPNCLHHGALLDDFDGEVICLDTPTLSMELLPFELFLTHRRKHESGDSDLPRRKRQPH